MTLLRVDVRGAGYDVRIGGGLLANSGELIRQAAGGQRAFVITDSNVRALYADAVCASLSQAGYSVTVHEIVPGEGSKSPQTLFAVWEAMAQAQIQRADVAVALGGGVVGDLCGFAAATYLRGIPFVQLPTSLLAQIDSSIGGKVAVDLPQGKNLVGNFYQPRLVLCDTDALDTLSDSWFFDGMAEAIKCGLIADGELFSLIEQSPDRPALKREIAQIVERCLLVKKHVVEQDEFDRGERMKLNYGHTFGHAIEAGTGYRMPHGHAVAAGMVLMSRYGEEAGITPPGITPRIRALAERMQLPTDTGNADPDAMTAALSRDKKAGSAGISAVLLTDIGSCQLTHIPAQELSQWLISKGGIHS